MDELQLVDWIARQVPASPAVPLGIGDDMAILSVPTDRPLLACDMLLDGVHFDSSRHSMRQIGRKAVARNFSDCAAMAVRPLAVTVAAALPRHLSADRVQELFGGILEIAAEFDCAVAGGDTARWEHPLAIDVAIVAVPFPGMRPVVRSGARVADRLYVTGKLGGSLLGRHMTFRPKLAEARQLATSLGHRLHAMIDISDGLSLDLWRLCRASKVGAIIEESMLEGLAHEDANAAAMLDGRSLIDHVLSDGEDYELLLAVDGPIIDSSAPVYPIGTVSDGELLLKTKDGAIRRLVPGGYIH
jgi:thiamine-monophosphate kinase